MAKRNADRARSCTEQRRKEEIAVGEVQRVTSRPHGWVRRALRSQDCCSAARLSPLLLRKSGILKNGIFSKGSSSAGKPEPKVDLSSGEQPACRAPLRLRCRGPLWTAGARVPAWVLPLAWVSTWLFTSHCCHITRCLQLILAAQRPSLTSCPRIPRCLPGLSFRFLPRLLHQTFWVNQIVLCWFM